MLESAVIGVVDGEWGEQEVLAPIVPAGGREPALPELVAFLAERLPTFMVPRYLRVVAELPKAQATLRIQKDELRRAGVTPDTWDRRSQDGPPRERARS